MSEITVTTQQQLDNLPRDYHGRIYIKFGTPYDKAIVRRKYDFASVEAWGTAPSWRGGTAPSWHGGTVKSAQRAIHLKLRHPAMHALCEIRVPLTNMSIFTALRTATAKRNCLRRLGNATGYTGRTGIQILCIRSKISCGRRLLH